VIIELEHTTSAQISSSLVKARIRAGSPAMGMVLTLIIVTDDKQYADAMQSAMEAGREHPSRILLAVTTSGRKPTLDAQLRIGEGTPGEVIVVRMSGAIADHPASVVRPLLLPDSPVVIWWPGRCPANPINDELAQLAGRRMTDAANRSRPLQALLTRAKTYRPGDTDLAWTRLTPWRALLAAALDQYPARITAVSVEAERSNPSADLLAAWLHLRLKLEVHRRNSHGPGLTAVRLGTAAGDIAITRPDGLLASYAVPGQPERLVALKRRDITELISEEMRRMDADEVYARVLRSLERNHRNSGSRRSASKKAAAKKTGAQKTGAQKTGAQKTGAEDTAAEEPAGGTRDDGQTLTRKSTAQKTATARKTTAKKTTTKKAPAGKTAKKTTARKTATKTATKRAAAKMAPAQTEEQS
jgi:glucose-6-phosphate dehydrogenase assembly protein OpcA